MQCYILQVKFLRYSFLRRCSVLERLASENLTLVFCLLYLVRLGLNCSAMQLLFAASTMHHKVPGSPIHFSVLSAFLVQIEQDLQSSTELIFICSANLMRLVPAKNHWANIICEYFLSFRCLFACSLETLRSCRMDHPCTSPSVGGWIGSMIELWFADEKPVFRIIHVACMRSFLANIPLVCV